MHEERQANGAEQHSFNIGLTKGKKLDPFAWGITPPSPLLLTPLVIFPMVLLKPHFNTIHLNCIQGPRKHLMVLLEILKN